LERMESAGGVVEESAFLQLAKEVESRAPLVHSPDHGAKHWHLVAWTGAELVETMPGADAVVVLLFALFHDSQRENEYDDPEHGARGAALAAELVPLHLPSLAPDRLVLLKKACELHTSAGPTYEPTLGTCWDSDRLNLWRVGTEPSPRYLSTPEAKRPERIEWSYHVQDRDVSWQEILRRYTRRGAV
jgi:uncharacterized protein